MSNKSLIIVFVVLVIAAVIIYFPSSEKTERTFKTELVEVDTATISEIVISPKKLNGGSYKIFRENEGWNIDLVNGKTVSVPKEKADRLIDQILSIKPLRLASRSKSKWTEFEVDSAATRVVVKEGSTTTLDVMIGKFLFQQPRSVSTYVRLSDETDVYLVEGFLSMSFNQDASSYRNNVLVSGDSKSWDQLTFSYPADSSFQMTKIEDKWFCNNIQLDSANTEKYLSGLSRLSNSNFIDEVDVSSLTPQYQLTIGSQGNTFATVSGYQIDTLLVVKSSLNSESHFDATQNNFIEKLFVGLNSLK